LGFVFPLPAGSVRERMTVLFTVPPT
jgi:hypothetical protein